MIFTSGFTDTHFTFYYEDAEVNIYLDKLEVKGSIKNAAFAIANAVLSSGEKSVSTTWNKKVRAMHGKGCYKLEYLQEDKPDFFDELSRQYEKICKMKVFW